MKQENTGNEKSKKLPIVIGNLFIVVLLLAVIIFIWHSKTQKESAKDDSLYSYKNDFVGDAANDAVILEKLHIGKNIGRYTLELTTEEEEKGLTIHFSDTISEEKEESLSETMKLNANVVLALIKNASYISWDYTSDADSTKKVTETYTLDDAKNYVGKDIKEFANSEGDFNGLLSKLGIE